MNRICRRLSAGVLTLWIFMCVTLPAYAESTQQFDKPQLSDVKNFFKETGNNLLKIVTNPWFFAFMVFFVLCWWRFTRGWQKKE